MVSTFMSLSCLIRSISKVSCCLVRSTSSWVCWVADSILTVSALCQPVQPVQLLVQPTGCERWFDGTSVARRYLPQQLGVAGHQLGVLLLQLVVPLLRGLGPFCTEEQEEMTAVSAAATAGK